MAGIYIHIPFCKQACYYCDFHFSTSLKKKEEMIDAIIKEMYIRGAELNGEQIETIYFGGGTPSILELSEINSIIQAVYDIFEVIEDPEITLEANPDDLDLETIVKLSRTKVNRLSIGIQSFFDEDLKMMNRAHNSTEAFTSLSNAVKYFKNISIDLIYGIPGMSLQRWSENVEKVLSLKIPHISSYALTVEPKTALNKLISTGKIPSPDDGIAHEHFLFLIDRLEKQGYIHYELSNFSLKGYFSKNNSAYWLGKKYLGIGPSAHSFDGEHRSWNISNNSLYIKAVNSDKLPLEIETLTQEDRYNEYIMTGLRTIWGVDMDRVELEFGKKYSDYLHRGISKYLKDELVQLEGAVLTVTNKGKFLSDGIASDLFYLQLS